jgi:periplasmic protein TonB
MKYNALLFCPDEKTARVVTQILTELDFRVEPCNEPFAAVKKLMSEHFDAIVVDCESEQNVALLFKSAHNSGSNQSSLAVAVVEGQAGVAKAFRIGANLVLTKPINIEQSKSTLRVARGLLRKTDAAKPANPAVPPSPPSAITSASPKRLSTPQISESKSAPVYSPAQPPSSPIPTASNSLFEVEADPGPKPEPMEAALLESMPDPVMPPPATAKEYPWQPIPKPAAEPMSTALRRAAEATGRSDAELPVATKILPSPASGAPISHSSISSTASGQAAATAPAKISPEPHKEAESPQLEAPAFASLGAKYGENGSGSAKKTILIAAVLVAAAALAYVGWTRMQPVNGTPVAQKLTAPVQAAPAPAQPPVPQAVPPSPSPAQDAAPITSAQPDTPQPIEQGPDITLSTSETRPPAPRKSTSIIASNTVVRAQSNANPPALLVVKNQISKPTPPTPAQPEAAAPLAPGSLAPSNASDQAISGIMSTTAANLPQPAPEKLKVSQGVSQGLLIKSVPPDYPAVAKQMRIQGDVELQASIGKDGSITGVKLLSGDAVLAHAAIAAVKQWKYKPYYLDDQPVEIQTQITVKFKLP